MKQSFFRHIYFTTFFLTFSLCGNLVQIARIAREVAKSTTPAATQQLLSELEKVQAKDLICTKTLFTTLGALLKAPTYVQTHGKVIPKSFIFFSVPGYLETLRFIVANASNENIVKGYSYELEHAWELYQSGHHILQFHLILTEGSKWREIDIRTNTHMIECKNMLWPHFYNERLCRKFCDQKRLVDHYNTIHNSRYTYQVSSKHQIPDAWKRWFAHKRILTYESYAH